MPRSKRWHDLEREVLLLRRHFLPSGFDALGQYHRPTQVQSRTRAFLVLSHAEVESYLEGLGQRHSAQEPECVGLDWQGNATSRIPPGDVARAVSYTHLRAHE